MSDVFEGIFGYGKDIMNMENFIAFFEIYIQNNLSESYSWDEYLQMIDDYLQSYHRRFTHIEEDDLEVPTLPNEDEDDEDELAL